MFVAVGAARVASIRASKISLACCFPNVDAPAGPAGLAPFHFEPQKKMPSNFRIGETAWGVSGALRKRGPRLGRRTLQGVAYIGLENPVSNGGLVVHAGRIRVGGAPALCAHVFYTVLAQ